MKLTDVDRKYSGVGEIDNNDIVLGEVDPKSGTHVTNHRQITFNEGESEKVRGASQSLGFPGNLKPIRNCERAKRNCDTPRPPATFIKVL